MDLVKTRSACYVDQGIQTEIIMPSQKKFKVVYEDSYVYSLIDAYENAVDQENAAVCGAAVPDLTTPSPTPTVANEQVISMDMETLKLLVSKLMFQRKPNMSVVNSFVVQNEVNLSTCMNKLNYTLKQHPTDEKTITALVNDKTKTVLIYGNMNPLALVANDLGSLTCLKTWSVIKCCIIFFISDKDKRIRDYAPKHFRLTKKTNLYEIVDDVFTVEEVRGP